MERSRFGIYLSATMQKLIAPCLLCLLTVAAVLVHGYHPGAEDAEIYLSAIKKDLNPSLYTHNAQFFMTHARMTLFDEIIAGSVRLTHIPLEAALLVWHVISILLLLTGCWMLARRCFPTGYGVWAGVSLIAALLTLPVAGTALYLMDQYLNPRSLSTPAILLGIVFTLDGRVLPATLCLLAAGMIHPHMTIFGVCFVFLLTWMKQPRWTVQLGLMSLPFGLSFSSPTGPYRATLAWKTYFFLRHWQWYEWLGILGPVVLLWAMARVARRQGLSTLELLSKSLVAFELAFFAGALVIEPFSGLGKLQPMRSLHIVYLLFFLFAGGLVGQFVLKNIPWRWLVLFLPLSGGMYYAQRQLFPDSAHIELPAAQTQNAWLQAFEWIRVHTPSDAYFALDPDYMTLPEENSQGFRALAERSMLADNITDSGAASMFPGLAEAWFEQTQDGRGWGRFQHADFNRLRQKYGVNWLVLPQSSSGSLVCPYHNNLLSVCRIDYPDDLEISKP